MLEERKENQSNKTSSNLNLHSNIIIGSINRKKSIENREVKFLTRQIGDT